MNIVKAFGDGGSRGNPGKSGSGCIVIDGENKYKRNRYLGIGTNNQAEYDAVKLILETYIEEKLKSDELHINMDSKLVVEQLSGRWKIKVPHLRELADEILDLIEEIDTNVRFSYVPRAQNAIADEQANIAMDRAV